MNRRALLVGMFLVLAGLIVPASGFLNPAPAPEAEFKSLFDGTSLKGWRGYNKKEPPKGWVAEDGALVRKGGGGDIATEEQFGDFELHFEWKISAGGNSGVMYRVSEGDKAPYESGPEYQVLDDAKHADGKNPATSAGSLYAMYAPQDKELKAVGEWNSSIIKLAGNHVEHWLNGKRVVKCEIGSEEWKQKLAKSKFKGWKKFATNAKGHLVFQDHGDLVSYRNIKIRSITEADLKK